MNTLILNRETFALPADDWYQIAPLGEFPHSLSGTVQVIYAAACASMVNRFDEESLVENFAGLLIDFDHFSLDEKNRSEAAGWITALENRETGLWAEIRWSDLGEDAVKGGRYRFLSPVWTRAEGEVMGADAYVTHGECGEVSQRILDKRGSIEKRLFRDNGTIFLQTRLDRHEQVIRVVLWALSVIGGAFLTSLVVSVVFVLRTLLNAGWQDGSESTV